MKRRAGHACRESIRSAQRTRSNRPLRMSFVKHLMPPLQLLTNHLTRGVDSTENHQRCGQREGSSSASCYPRRRCVGAGDAGRGHSRPPQLRRVDAVRRRHTMRNARCLEPQYRETHMVAVASGVGQAMLCLAYVALVGACALASAHHEIILPGPWFYLAFWAAPCLSMFLVIRLSRNKRASLRIVIWLGALALGIVILRGQMKLLVAYASSLDDAPFGGVLSNFFVTAHSAFDVPLLAAAAGAFVLALTAHRWAATMSLTMCSAERFNGVAGATAIDDRGASGMHGEASIFPGVAAQPSATASGRMKTPVRQPIDCNGTRVSVGSRVQVLGLSGDWFENLPEDERTRVESMIGEVFEIEEVDEYGQPWVCKRWPNEAEGNYQSHSVALEPCEMLAIEPGSR